MAVTALFLFFVGFFGLVFVGLVGVISYTVGKTEGYSEGWDDSERLGAKYVRRAASSQERERP